MADEPVVFDLDDPYFDGPLPDALRDYDHVHSATGVCVKNVKGAFCPTLRRRVGADLNTFDAIQAKAHEIVTFHMVSHGLSPTFTEDERDAIELGMSSGIHAAIEHFTGVRS